MAKTLLQLVQTVAEEIGLTSPNAVVSSTDLIVVQLKALANRVGNDLCRNYEWRRLVKEYVFQTTATYSKTGTTVADSTVITSMSNTTSLAAGMVVSGDGVPPYAEIASVDGVSQITLNMACDATGTGTTLTFATQDYALPSDFDRMVPDTQWDRSDHWQNLGPKSSQEWQWLQGGVISTGPRFRYRIYGNKLRLFPAPTDVYNMAYEYVSTSWILASGGTVPTKSSFTVDTDTFIYPDDLMEVGLKAYWKREKGLDYMDDLTVFDRKASVAAAQDEPVGRASLAPSVPPVLISPYSIPDGSWNQ